MPSVSKSQQRLFGMVHACQKYGKGCTPHIKKIADGISDKDAEDFASTKHKGLPDKKEEGFKEWLKLQEIGTGTNSVAVFSLPIGTNIKKLKAKKALAEHLLESNVDIENFGRALQIICEWDYNPASSFAKSAGAGAGAVIGSALGPVGTALGGLAGGSLGSWGSKLFGKFMNGSKVEPASGVYQKAVQAVDNLSQILNSPDMAQITQGQNIKNNVNQIKINLQSLQQPIASLDQQRNQNLDQKLQAGGGIGNKLRSANGNSTFGKIQNWLGNKIQNIPALNQDMGLRRAISQGMDSIQNWAQQNPQKAALLNMGASGLGAMTGALGASGAGFGNNTQPQQPQPTNSSESPNPWWDRGTVTGNDHGPNNNLPATNSRSWRATYTPDTDAAGIPRPKFKSPSELMSKWTKYKGK